MLTVEVDEMDAAQDIGYGVEEFVLGLFVEVETEDVLAVETVGLEATGMYSEGAVEGLVQDH